MYIKIEKVKRSNGGPTLDGLVPKQNPIWKGPFESQLGPEETNRDDV